MGIFDITDKYIQAKANQIGAEMQPSKQHEQPLVVEVNKQEEKSFIYRETL